MVIKRYPRLMIPCLISCVFSYFAFFFHDSSYYFIKTTWLSYYGDFDYSLLGALKDGAWGCFYNGSSPYNPVLWTMQTEILGSFLIYTLCFFHFKFKSILFPFLSVFFIVLFIHLKVINPKLGLGLISFVFGYFVFFYGKTLSNYTSVFMLLLGLYLSGAHNTSVSYRFIYFFLNGITREVCCFFAGLILVYVCINSELISKLLNNNYTLWMGKVSFSVYLLHMPVIYLFGFYFFERFISLFGSYYISVFLCVFFVIFISCFLSVLFCKYIDGVSVIISNHIERLAFKFFYKLNVFFTGLLFYKSKD